MDWTTACPDWKERIKSRRSLVPFDPLFPSEAADAMRVFHELRVVDAPGMPTMGEISRPWVNDFVASVFGSYDAETGRRLVTEWFLLISKKNTKSTTAAGVMLTALLRNWRQSGEFLILAPTIEVANNAYAPARDMVRHDEELSALLLVQDHLRTITHRETGATLKVVAADNETVGGKKAIGVLVDELWMFGKKPGAENMLREATGGLASRPEGFVIYLTTQSDEPPAGIFAQKLKYARDVRDGVVKDKRFVPVLYEFPPEMVKAKEHRDPANFYITNPNLGASVDEEFLNREFAKAENAGEESMRGFLAKHLNIEIGLALRSDRWAGADFWERQSTAGLGLTELLARSEVVVVGIDGGGLDDMLGLCVMGREAVTGNWLTWCKAWISPLVLERRKSEAARFADFASDGDLGIVEQLPDDVSGLVDVVSRVYETGLLAKVGLDPSRIGILMKALIDAGIPEDALLGVSQGWRLMGAIVVAERKLAEGALWHGGTRLMSWCVGNARIEQRGNAILVTKAVSGTAKIDPLMAMFCAAELMATNPESAAMPQIHVMDMA